MKFYGFGGSRTDVFLGTLGKAKGHWASPTCASHIPYTVACYLHGVKLVLGTSIPTKGSLALQFWQLGPEPRRVARLRTLVWVLKVLLVLAVLWKARKGPDSWGSDHPGSFFVFPGFPFAPECLEEKQVPLIGIIQTVHGTCGYKDIYACVCFFCAPHLFPSLGRGW